MRGYRPITTGKEVRPQKLRYGPSRRRERRAPIRTCRGGGYVWGVIGRGGTTIACWSQNTKLPELGFHAVTALTATGGMALTTGLAVGALALLVAGGLIGATLVRRS